MDLHKRGNKFEEVMNKELNSVGIAWNDNEVFQAGLCTKFILQSDHCLTGVVRDRGDTLDIAVGKFDEVTFKPVCDIRRSTA